MNSDDEYGDDPRRGRRNPSGNCHPSSRGRGDRDDGQHHDYDWRDRNHHSRGDPDGHFREDRLQRRGPDDDGYYGRDRSNNGHHSSHYHSNSWGRGDRDDNSHIHHDHRDHNGHFGEEYGYYGRDRYNNGHNSNSYQQICDDRGDSNDRNLHFSDRSVAERAEGGGSKRPASGAVQESATDPPKRIRSREAAPPPRIASSAGPAAPGERPAAAAIVTSSANIDEAPGEKPATPAIVTSSTNVDCVVDSFEIPENEESYKRAFVDCLRENDKNITSVANQAHQVREGWNARKRAATQKALQILNKLSREGAVDRCKRSNRSPYSDESSSDDDYPPGGGCPNIPQRGLTNAERKFVSALQYCPPLDAGFQVVSSWAGASKICYCPCGKSLAPWRERHGILLEEECHKTQTGKSQFEPYALMAHLKREEGVFQEKQNRKMVNRPLTDIHHYATRVYLECLYCDWHGRRNGKGFGHKGLYPAQAKEHEAASCEESRLLHRQIEIGRKEIRRQELENLKLKDELELKEKERQKFMELSRDHQKMIEHLESLREKLQVEKKKDEKISDEKIAKYEEKLMEHFFMLKRLVGASKEVQITVMGEAFGDRGFSLQDFFDKMYAKKAGDARAALFGDENSSNRITKLIVSDWNIIYDKQESYGFERKNEAGAKSRKKEDTGVDEGGPSRQFLTDVFKQLDTLHIKGSKVTNIELFTHSPCGVKVTTDDYLDHQIKMAAKQRSKEDGSSKEYENIVKDLTKRSKDYVRAIGRIMLNAIVRAMKRNKEDQQVEHYLTLPSNALPPFFMNVMLHGYDSDYHRDDILQHINLLSVGSKLHLDKDGIKWIDNKGNEYGIEHTDENGNEWTPDTFFGSYIPENFIHSSKILLSSLQEGLTFGGQPDPPHELKKGCGLSSIFSTIPLQAIQRIYFAKPNISVQDLWDVLEPLYGEGEPPAILGMTDDNKQRLKREQMKFFDRYFERYLKESYEDDETFLVKFVQCATGSNYLPYDKKMKIKIEFNFSYKAEGLPNFHACDSVVALPGYEVFFCDYDVFKTKMNFAIGEVHNQFYMH